MAILLDTSHYTNKICRGDLTILVYIKNLSKETELLHKIRYFSSKKDVKERGFVPKYKSISNHKISEESGTKKHMTKMK